MAWDRYRVRLYISLGANGYRWLAKQVEARREACNRGRRNDAAVPRTSSYGGTFNDRDAMACDISEWGDFPGGRARHLLRPRPRGGLRT